MPLRTFARQHGFDVSDSGLVGLDVGASPNGDAARVAGEAVESLCPACATRICYSPDDLKFARDAQRFSFKLFDGLKRKWGPHEEISLMYHITDVGGMLLAAGSRREVVAAGYLHDVLEGYKEIDEAEVLRDIEKRFGPRVVELIQMVTEPPKAGVAGNWEERKLSVMRRVLDSGDREAGELLCATKASTLSFGNKHLWEGKPIEEWSSGTYEDNRLIYGITHAVCKQLGVSNELLGQLELEVARLETHNPARKGNGAVTTQASTFASQVNQSAQVAEELRP